MYNPRCKNNTSWTIRRSVCQQQQQLLISYSSWYNTDTHKYCAHTILCNYNYKNRNSSAWSDWKFLQMSSHSLCVYFRTSNFLMVDMDLPYYDWRSARYIRVHRETATISKFIWMGQIRPEKPPFPTQKQERYVNYLWLLYFMYIIILCKCECYIHIYLNVKSVESGS